MTITKHGRPVAIPTPPDTAEESGRSLHGFMKGAVVGLDEIDLTEPILDEPFSTEADKFRR